MPTSTMDIHEAEQAWLEKQSARVEPIDPHVELHQVWAYGEMGRRLLVVTPQFYLAGFAVPTVIVVNIDAAEVTHEVSNPCQSLSVWSLIKDGELLGRVEFPGVSSNIAVAAWRKANGYDD